MLWGFSHYWEGADQYLLVAFRNNFPGEQDLKISPWNGSRLFYKNVCVLNVFFASISIAISQLNYLLSILHANSKSSGHLKWSQSIVWTENKSCETDLVGSTVLKASVQTCNWFFQSSSLQSFVT